MSSLGRDWNCSLGTVPEKTKIALVLAVLFVLTVAAIPAAQAQTFSVIHDFSGTDGFAPYAGVTLDAAGNLYGTTSQSFTGDGTAFQLKRSHGNWVLNSLFTFTGTNGAYPFAGIVFGPDGALYGTTNSGGLGKGFGVVYNLRPPRTACKSALCPWTETVLYPFTGGSDGSGPSLGNPVFDKNGNLYGTTQLGGDLACSPPYGCGTVYQLTPSASGWTESVLYSFSGGNDGSEPASGVILDEAGNLYGITYQGGGIGCGGRGCGTVFQLSPSGSGWKETILYSFTGGSDGGNPYGGLIFDQSGNLYGTTLFGGSGGGGTVFELSPSGGGWTFTLVYALTGYDAGPVGSLAMDGAGNLYGTTNANGAYGNGSVFKLQPSNGGWIYTTLHDFTYRGPDGSLPVAGPTVDAKGNVYGTTSQGGTQYCGFEVQCGVVWEITP